MAQRKRTIQHPGFEFWETEKISSYSYVQNTEAMTIGYFAKGPIGTPVKISSMSELESIFGLPETEPEYYSYKGIQQVISNNRSITVIRFPYDNTTSILSIPEDNENKSYFQRQYKILKGNFEVAPESTGRYPDISAAYIKDINFKSIQLTPDIVGERVVNMLSSKIPDDADFVIVNKNNDFKTILDNEYVVSIIGNGNAIRKQNLSAETIDINQIEYFKSDYNGTKTVYIPDERQLTYAKYYIRWQTTGDLNEDGSAKTVADKYFNDLCEYVPAIPCNDVYDIKLNEYYYGLPERTCSFKIFLDDEFINGLKPGDIISVPEHLINRAYAEAQLSYGDYINASGTNCKPTDYEISQGAYSDYNTYPEKYITSKNVDNAEIEVLSISNVITDDANVRYKLPTYKFRINFYNYEDTEDGQVKTLVESYPITVEYDELTIGQQYIWSFKIPATYNKTDGYYVDNRSNDNVTVIVSKITNSNLESGTYVIEPVEIFSGSLSVGSRNLITNESNYIGDIINDSSQIISFYGKSSYKGFNKETDTILTEQTMPYGLSLINGAALNLTSLYIPGDYDTCVDLRKNYKKGTKTSINLADVVEELLRLVKNNNMYTYRDVYDFGLSSVLSELKLVSNISGGKTQYNYYFDPNRISENTVQSVNEYNETVYVWKRIIKKFLYHCQHQHRLSMFHADGPRNFILNGQLSRVDDLRLSQDEIVLTGKKIRQISIKDSTYGDINVQWWQTLNEFTAAKMWVPNSIQLAGNITRNDIINRIWDAPAGQNYGFVSNYYRPAFNPNNTVQDNLYINSLNYGVSWPTGIMSIEGQKTAYGENSALSRINVRRLMIYIERFVQTASSKYRYQPNTEDVRSSFIYELNQEFSRLYTLGALYGYRVVCDGSNNPPEVIDNNELRIAIMVQPVKTLEYVVAQFIIAKTSTNLAEVTIY